MLSYFTLFPDEDVHDTMYGVPGNFHKHDSYIAFLNSNNFQGEVRFKEWEIEEMIDTSGLEAPFYVEITKPQNRYGYFFDNIIISNDKNIPKMYMKELLFEEKIDQLSLKYQDDLNERQQFNSDTDPYLAILLLDKSLVFSKARFTQAKLELNREVIDPLLVYQPGTNYLEFKHREYHLLKLRHTCNIRNWLLIDTLVFRGIYTSDEYDYQLWWSTMLLTGERALPWSYVLPSTESKKRYLTSEFVAKEYENQFYLRLDSKLSMIEKWTKHDEY